MNGNDGEVGRRDDDRIGHVKGRDRRFVPARYGDGVVDSRLRGIREVHRAENPIDCPHIDKLSAKV